MRGSGGGGAGSGGYVDAAVQYVQLPVDVGADGIDGKIQERHGCDKQAGGIYLWAG